jgi:hypothetical protein
MKSPLRTTSTASTRSYTLTSLYNLLILTASDTRLSEIQWGKYESLVCLGRIVVPFYDASYDVDPFTAVSSTRTILES